MILNFDKELNDKSTYEYNISNTSERMFTLIEILLGIDWNMKTDLINRSTRSASPVTMNAVDTETNIIQYLWQAQTIYLKIYWIRIGYYYSFNNTY